MIQTHSLMPEEIVKMVTVKDVQMAPKGDQVAFVVNSASKEQVKNCGIWLAGANGGFCKKIEYEQPNACEPRWSPDGKYLAFIFKGARNKLCLMDYYGQLLQAFELPTGSKSIEWSPDGRYISFLSKLTINKAENLFIIEITSGEIRQVSKGDCRVTRYVWSPDSKSIAVALNQPDRIAEQDLMIFYLEQEKPRFLMTIHDMTIMLAWSPDGKHVVWCGREHTPDSGQIMVVPVIDEDLKSSYICNDFPGSVKWIGFFPDGRLIFAALKNFRVGIYATNLLGENVSTLMEPDALKSGSLGCGSFADFQISLSKAGDKFAAPCSGPKEPGNVIVGEWENGMRRITDFNPEVKAMKLGESEEIVWKGRDGLQIHGLLIKPVNYEQGKRYPAIVEIHGGPRRSWWDTCYVTNSWAQLLATRGYMVLLPNPRGSSGRGADFVRANERDLGGEDFYDVMCGVDEIISRGFADSERLGIAGWSYGGFLTSWTITQTDRFKAAVMGASIVDWLSWNEQSKMAASWSHIHWRQPLIAKENPDKLLKRSPVHYVQNVSTPALIFHGINDPKIPAAQSDEFYAALAELNKPVSYMRYPREGHGVKEEAHQIDLFHRLADWFDEHIG